MQRDLAGNAVPAAAPYTGPVEGDEAQLEETTKQVFSNYVCRSSVTRGRPHPGDIAEAASLR